MTPEQLYIITRRLLKQVRVLRAVLSDLEALSDQTRTRLTDDSGDESVESDVMTPSPRTEPK